MKSLLMLEDWKSKVLSMQPPLRRGSIGLKKKHEKTLRALANGVKGKFDEFAAYDFKFKNLYHKDSSSRKTVRRPSRKIKTWSCKKCKNPNSLLQFFDKEEVTLKKEDSKENS